jgi:hypothetical protein
MQLTNWTDFNDVATKRGLAPALVEQLRRIHATYINGGCDLTAVRWFFTRYAPWARVMAVGSDSVLEDQADGQRKPAPVILYPSTLLIDSFCCEAKPDILWVYGDRGGGKSVFTYGMAEAWLDSARTWLLCEKWGSPRIYVYGDAQGLVPSEPGWFRCPDWFVVARNSPDFPLLELYDEVPLGLRAGGVSKETKAWAEKLTRSRHYHVWTVMNMVQAKMATKRGRDMDALTLDRFSGLRELRERIDDLPLTQFKEVWRRTVPNIRRFDPGLAMTQINEDQGEPGTWLTLYETVPPSWLEWREAELKTGDLLETAAPWPPEAVHQRSKQYAEGILKKAQKQCAGEPTLAEEWKAMLGASIESDGSEQKATDRIMRHIMRGAGMEWAAIGEVLAGDDGVEGEKMGGGGSLQRWGHRNKLDDCSDLIIEAATMLNEELPVRNRSPVCWGLTLHLMGAELE